MAATSPIKEPPGSDAPTPRPPQLTPKPSATPLKPETPSSATPPAATPRPTPARPAPDADVVFVPSYSRWFSWENIHECEVRFLPEFFDSRASSKNPNLYKYYRNSIIKQFRENPSRKITFTDARRTLVGDVGSIRRVFDFLELWGLINYTSSAASKPLRWDDTKDNKSSADSALHESSAPAKEALRRVCSGCKSVCSIACFACDKYDLTLCARCYVRGNYRVGVNTADFRRVEISEEAKTDWTEKETLQLLEAIMHFGDDWKKVAQHVGGRSEKDCIAQFIKLPFGGEFFGHPDSIDAKSEMESNKRMRLSPLADASNPIMAQAAFLSALAGVDTVEAAARAAVKTLTEVDRRTSTGDYGSITRNIRPEANFTSNGDSNLNGPERASVDDNSLLEKEEHDVESAISGIVEVKMKEIQDKILRFEEVDLQMEKEWQQLERLKNLLFADQLNLLFQKGSALKTEEKTAENVKVS